MKNYFFIASFMVAGPFLQASQGQRILDRIEKEEKMANRSYWESTGPTSEDILAATEVKNPAAKESREDKLINAVKANNLKNVEAFIAEGASLEARDSNDMTALMIAADKGFADISRVLIDAGAHVNAKNKFNWTPLFWAAQNKHAEIVKILIANGDATEARYFKEFFQGAVHQGDTHMVKALLLGIDRLDDDALDNICRAASYHRRSKPELYNAIAEALNKRAPTVLE